MAECSVDTLISEGKCFSGACLTPDQQRIAMLQLLCQISETAGGGGVDSILAGAGIGVDTPTGTVTVSNTGVLSNLAGSGITVSGATGDVTIGNSGVLSLAAGTGIEVSGATGAVTARYSGPTYTTAQLLALSSAESAKVMVARCTDCFASGANMTTFYGDVVYWNGYNWLTVSDNVPATTDWVEFSLNKSRLTNSGEMRPTTSVVGDNANLSTQNIPAFTSGAGAVGSSAVSSGSQLVQWGLTPGTTNTGAVRSTPIYAVNSAAAPYRDIGCVMNFVSGSTSLSNLGVDNWYWKVGISTSVLAASGALQNDEICFVMDDANTLGLGATGTQLYALIRINGTTLDFIATGINPTTTSKYLIATWEPTGVGGAGRARLAVADSLGSGLTTIADRSGTLAASLLQPYAAGVKTLGTGTRTMNRRWMKAITYRIAAANGGVLS